MNPLAAWPSVFWNGLLPGTDGAHPVLCPPRRQMAAEDATSLQPLSGLPRDPIFHITHLHSPCGGFTSSFSEKNRFLLAGLLSYLEEKNP